jgi:hypothetical protein
MGVIKGFLKIIFYFFFQKLILANLPYGSYGFLHNFIYLLFLDEKLHIKIIKITVRKTVRRFYKHTFPRF